MFTIWYGQFFCLALLKTEMNYLWTKYNQNTNPSEFFVKQRAKSNKQQVKSNEQWTKCNEQRAKTNEQQVTSNKQKLTSNEHRAKRFTSLQNVSGFLFCYKVSQNVTIFLQYMTVITNCDIYYKMHWYKGVTTDIMTLP